jgi:hypothetical protein
MGHPVFLVYTHILFLVMNRRSYARRGSARWRLYGNTGDDSCFSELLVHKIFAKVLSENSISISDRQNYEPI